MEHCNTSLLYTRPTFFHSINIHKPKNKQQKIWNSWNRRHQRYIQGPTFSTKINRITYLDVLIINCKEYVFIVHSHWRPSIIFSHHTSVCLTFFFCSLIIPDIAYRHVSAEYIFISRSYIFSLSYRRSILYVTRTFQTMSDFQKRNIWRHIAEDCKCFM